MATKPGTTFTFATNATYSVGPTAPLGATKIPPPDFPNGFVPATGVDAEHVNTLFNIAGQWITDWLALGSAVAGLDAHLVETNSAGETRIATGVFGGTAGTAAAIVANANTAVLGQTTILALNASSGIAGDFGGGSASLPAVRVVGTGEGVNATGGGAGAGVTAIGGATGDGLQAQGNATGHGVTAIAGADGCGVQAIGVLTSTEPALAAFGGFAPGAQVRGTLYLQPTSVPSTPIDGDHWKRGGTASVARGGLEWFDPAGAASGVGAGKQRAHSTTNGFGYGYAESVADTTEDGTSTVDKVTLAMGSSAGEYAQPDGDYIVEYSATVRLGAAAGLGIRAIVRFIYPGGGSVPVFVDFAAVSERKPVSFFVKHSLVNPAGPDLFKIQIASNGGVAGPASEVIIDNARIVARGSYE